MAITQEQKGKQEHRKLAIATPLGEDALLLIRMSGTEQLGRPFEYQLELASHEHSFNAEDIIGQNVTIRCELSTGETRYFNGFVSRFIHIPSSGKLAQYQATVVPWLWFLTRIADCRIFQKKTVPDIIKEVFKDRGFTNIKDTLKKEKDYYRTWEYCVQYRETDFNFVSRLMEQEGIHYYFMHENGEHTLVLADSSSAHESYPGYEELEYHPADKGTKHEDCVSTWVIETNLQSGSFALKDFDFKKSQSDLLTRSIADGKYDSSEFEIYDYPGKYTETGDGEEYTKKRNDELQAQYEVVTGSSDSRGICTGSTFELINQIRDDQNREYLITSINYKITSPEFYSDGLGSSEEFCSCEFTAIDKGQPFRSPRITPKPSIPGPQTAIVVGPKGDEIYTDEYSRIKVKFHWDRYSKADENSSCWIRVAQVWAGKRWGAMYIPRIGQEVIVEFLEGDPDRPIITGRVYNNPIMPPYELPANKTMSTLKSNSSKGGGGFNEIRFEDKKESEQIFIHGEKNIDIRAKNDRFETIKNNRHLHVEKDKFEKVDNNRDEKVGADHKEEIVKDRHLKIVGKEAKEVGGSHSFTVKGDVIEVFKAKHSEETTGDYYLKAGGIVIEATNGITLKSGTNSVVIDSMGVTLTGNKVTIDGKSTMINSGPGSPAASGVAGMAVAPASPTLAEDADEADPGQMAEIKAEQIETKSGKYGSEQVKPFKPPEEEESTWLKLKLVDEEGNPVPGEKYRILTQKNNVFTGTLDEKGCAHIVGLSENEKYEVTFPDLDEEQWEKA